MEQEMPDYETIRAAVVSEKWALEKVLACYGDEINRLAMVKKRQPDGSVKVTFDGTGIGNSGTRVLYMGERGNRRRFTANAHTETVRSYPTIPNRKGVIP